MGRPGQPACSDEEFIALFKEHGGTKTAQLLDVSPRSVFLRRRHMEEKFCANLSQYSSFENYPARLPLKILNGEVFIGSDPHLWPGKRSTAQRAFLKFTKEKKPLATILNGDCFDGAQIGRHPPLGFQNKPSVSNETEAVDDYLTDLVLASPKSKHLWTLGNHDARFESALVNGSGKDFKDVKGFLLKDHFPAWTIVTSIWINEHIVIKHRLRNGIHATTMGPLWSGKTTVTGHLHSLQVRPLSDYNGTRWGVDTGTLADIQGPQFDYGEDNPTNHRSGFIVLTFVNGRLMWPEIVSVVDENTVEFRAQLIKV